MKDYLITFIGFLLIACPFTIIIGIYLINKGLERMEI